MKETNENTVYYAVADTPMRLVDKRTKFSPFGAASNSGVDSHFIGGSKKVVIRKLTELTIDDVLEHVNKQETVKVFRSKADAESFAASLQQLGKTSAGEPIKASPPIFEVTLKEGANLGPVNNLAIKEIHAKSGLSNLPIQPNKPVVPSSQKASVSFYTVNREDIENLENPHFLEEAEVPIIEPPAQKKGKCSVM